MRRKDKEITDRGEIEEIIGRAIVCRLAMVDENGAPYIVPVNFGYVPGKLYIHSAREGRKVDILRKNDRVCFEMETDVAALPDVVPCKWSVQFRCAIGTGRASFVSDAAEKKEALEIICRHYLEGPFEVPENASERVLIIRIDIDSLTGKISGLPRE